MSAVLEGIRSQFDSDKEGDVQLARFKQLAQVFEEEAKKDMEAGLHAFQKEACAKLAIMFASTSGCTNLDGVHGTTTKLHCMICGMLAESVIQSLLCPLLAHESCEVGPGSAFLQRVQRRSSTKMSRASAEMKRWKHSWRVKSTWQSGWHWSTAYTTFTKSSKSGRT